MAEDITTEPKLGALELSDEEFMEQDSSEFFEESNVSENKDSDTEETANISESSDSDKDNKEDNSEAQEQTETVTDTKEVTKPEGDTQTGDETFEDSTDSESSDTSKKDSPETKRDTSETKETDYKGAYEKITQPFKANGAEIQVKDPNDIIRLMQMGANYQKKMAQMKPNLKLIKMLGNNGLLDEAKLNNLIDISKKDPKTIAKLIKDSEIDPLDIDNDESNDYQPTDHSISDKEFELDTVLESIKDTPSFNKTIDVLTKQWDPKSKTIISDSPEIIATINTHMENGVYDTVNSVLQQQKTLGKLNGLPDVEAYWQIAQQLLKQGIVTEQTSNSKDNTNSSESSETKSKAAEELKRNKKSAAPVKQIITKKGKEETNYLNLSDDEFMKKFAVR